MNEGVIKYINDILEKKIVTSEYFYKAVQRFVDFYDRQDEMEIYFDAQAAEKVFRFSELFVHYKGQFAGKPFHLENWQKFIIYDTYSWKYKSTRLRVKTQAYLQVARKNGKTTLGAILCLYGLLEEPAAEVILAATTKEQSSILLRDAKNFALNAPKVAAKLNILKYSIEEQKTAGLLKNISSDSSVQDGLSPSTVFIDEYHGFKYDDLLEVLESGMGSRRQPLLWIITTAGYILEGPCHILNREAKKILDNVETNDRANYYSFELDPLDDVSDPDILIKANPNLDVSVSKQYLIEQYEKTRLNPAKINNYLTKHCNIFVSGSYQFMRPSDWDKCVHEYSEKDLAGQKCWGGLDLSIKNDLSAFVLVFPYQDGSYKILNYNFSHQGKLQSDTDGINYNYYQKKGYIYLNAGNTVDYDQIEYKILELSRLFDIQSIAYDRYLSFQIVPHLEARELVLNPMGQGFVSMSTPVKHMQNLIANAKLHHNNNELLNKQMSLIDVESDGAGNLKFSKKQKMAKIDSAVALAMAIGEYLDFVNNNPESVYEKRDIIFL